MRFLHDGNELLSIDLPTMLAYMQCNKLNGRTTTAGHPVPIAASDVRPNGDRHAYDFDFEEEHPPLGSRAQYNPRIVAIVGSRFGRFGHFARRNPLRCQKARSRPLNREFLWRTSSRCQTDQRRGPLPSLLPSSNVTPAILRRALAFLEPCSLRTRANALLSAAFRTLMSRP